jgi:putative heme transporter
VTVLALTGRATLTDSVTTFGHLDWPWIPLAVVAEASSMAAFARAQRRLLRVGGTNLRLGSVMAVTYAGNAISVSLPLAGPEAATGFIYRRYHRLGIDQAVVAWALAVSGMFSSLAFALVLLGGAATSRSATASTFGLIGAGLALLPSVGVLAALRYDAARRVLNQILDRIAARSRRLFGRPGPDAAGAIERFLDRVASLRLSRLQYFEILTLAVWNWTADCLCLAFAIRATGANIPWQGLLLAYAAGMGAAGIGLTPGGLGVVEAALSATLVAAGIKDHRALAAVLVYRLVSFWLVMAAGWAVMAILSRTRRLPAGLPPDPPGDHSEPAPQESH